MGTCSFNRCPFVLFLYSSCQVRELAYRAGDHQFLVRMNDADRNPAGRQWKSRPHSPRFAVRRVRFQEIPAFANAGADDGRVFADATREHERVQSAKRRRKSPDPLLHLIAKQRDCFGCPHVFVSRPSKSCMSELVSDMPSRPDSKFTISLNCFALYFLSTGQIPDQSGIEIA